MNCKSGSIFVKFVFFPQAINVLRKHRELCDVVLIVANKKIFAHRVILSACSPYFHAMFTGGIEVEKGGGGSRRRDYQECLDAQC